MLIQYVHFHIVPLDIFGFAVKLSTQECNFVYHHWSSHMTIDPEL